MEITSSASDERVVVYYDGIRYKSLTFCCNIAGPSPVETYRKSIHGLHKHVLSCSDGWLVLHDFNKNDLSLCNSSTFDTITLPYLRLHDNIDTCILFDAALNSPDFKVLLFLKNIPSIMCFRLGDEDWSVIRYGDQLKALDYGDRVFGRAISCGGKIYARLMDWGCYCHTCIWSIEIVEEPTGVVLSRLEGPEWNHPHSEQCDDHVLESCGELFWLCLRTDSEILVVEVNKLNPDTMVWERVKSLKDAAFFISERYCLSCPASGLGSGCIYFTMSKDKNVYCYYDESFSMSFPCPDLPTPWHSSPTCIIPQVLKRPKDDCTQNYINQIELDKNMCREELAKKEPSPDEVNQLSVTIPFAVLQAVTTHLIALDYLNFRSASRICRSVAPPINWRKTLTGSNVNYPFPLLMFPKKDQSLYKFIDPRVNSNHMSNCYLMKIPSHLEDTTIRYSNHGWLLLSGAGGAPVHLYNPFTRDIIHYNYIRGYGSREISFFFTLKPSDSGCFLVTLMFDPIIAVIVSTIEGEKWNLKELQKRTFDAAHSSPVLFQDAYYYLDESGDIGIFKIEDEDNMSWEVLEKIQKPCNRFQPNFLVECGGELLSVFIRQHEGRKVGVYKLNQSKRAWDTVVTLGDYALYLSRSSSFSIRTSHGLGNRIYLPSFRDSGIVFFSLDTGKWHSSGSRDSWNNLYVRDSLGNLCGTRLDLDSCWIKPSWC